MTQRSCVTVGRDMWRRDLVTSPNSPFFARLEKSLLLLLGAAGYMYACAALVVSSLVVRETCGTLAGSGVGKRGERRRKGMRARREDQGKNGEQEASKERRKPARGWQRRRGRRMHRSERGGAIRLANTGGGTAETRTITNTRNVAAQRVVRKKQASRMTHVGQRSNGGVAYMDHRRFDSSRVQREEASMNRRHTKKLGFGLVDTT